MKAKLVGWDAQRLKSQDTLREQTVSTGLSVGRGIVATVLIAYNNDEFGILCKDS